MGPARAFWELPGSIPQASPRRAGCKSGLTNDSVQPKSFSNPGDYEEPQRGLVRTGLRGTWKVFTFVEGLISVKDDRASASENHVCMGFFSPPANTQALQRSDTVQGRNHARLQAGMLLWANQVPGAKLSLWILVPSNSGFCELGKHDTCLRHLSWVPTAFCRRLARCPLWAPSPSGNFPWPWGQMPEDFPSMHEQDRSSGIMGWITGQ